MCREEGNLKGYFLFLKGMKKLICIINTINPADVVFDLFPRRVA
jgi:hypothetical protein